MNLAVAIALMLALTLLVARTVRGKETPAPITTFVFGLVVIALMVGLFTYTRSVERDRDNDRRAAAAAAQAAVQRAFDAQVSQHAACEARVGSRNDLRDALYAIVDLSDLFPNAPAAKQYTATRDAVIDVKARPLTVAEECGPVPTPPTTTTGGNP